MTAEPPIATGGTWPTAVHHAPTTSGGMDDVPTKPSSPDILNKQLRRWLAL